MKDRVKIELDLLAPFVIEKELGKKVYNVFYTMEEDIKNSKISINIDKIEHLIKVKFKKTRKKNKVFLRNYKTVILEFEVDFEDLFSREKIYDNQNKEVKLDLQERLAIQKSCVETEIQKYIMDFIFAINLAYPGFFEIGERKNIF